MLFGVDYDNTFSADPDGFRLVVNILRSRGHDFVLVTGRSDEGKYGEEIRTAIGDLMPIVFAGGMWKRTAARTAGYNIDVWIDDNPEYIDKQYLLYTEFKDRQMELIEQRDGS